MSPKASWISGRRVARVYAVQAAYCVACCGQSDLESLKSIFDLYDQGMGEYDRELFYAILFALVSGYEQNDVIIKEKLIDGWEFDRFDLVVLSIIRAALFEMTVNSVDPTKVIISEYVDISHHFVTPSQASFVNAILDKLKGSVNPPSDLL